MDMGFIVLLAIIFVVAIFVGAKNGLDINRSIKDAGRYARKRLDEEEG